MESMLVTIEEETLEVVTGAGISGGSNASLAGGFDFLTSLLGLANLGVHGSSSNTAFAGFGLGSAAPAAPAAPACSCGSKGGGYG